MNFHTNRNFFQKSIHHLPVMALREKSLEEELSYSICLPDQISKSVKETKTSFMLDSERTEICKRVDRIYQMLLPNILITTAWPPPPLYKRPVRRIVSQVNKTLEGALSLAHKCQRSGSLRDSDFPKLSTLLTASLAYLEQLVNAYVSDSWYSFAFEAGGISLLLKLLKEGDYPYVQIGAATALTNLATGQGRVKQIVDELAIPIIVQVLSDSPITVQISVANLVSRMAEHDPNSQEEFAKENVIKPLVSLLSFYTLLDERKPHLRGKENEKPEVKLMLKTKCAQALWSLSKGSVGNTKRITDTKGLFCLAKCIQKEKGDLRLHCLMTVMEIAAVMESNPELRLSASKTNSPAVKALMDQLLIMISKKRISSLQISAIKSIGSLVGISPKWETRIIVPLVTLLHKDWDVGKEAAIALRKFASPENSLSVQHSKVIIQFDGLQPLMRRVRPEKWLTTAKMDAQLHDLILLCYLALHVGNSGENTRLLAVLNDASCDPEFQAHPLLKQVIPKAVYHLELNQVGADPTQL